MLFYCSILFIPFLHIFGFYGISVPLTFCSIAVFSMILYRGKETVISFNLIDFFLIIFLLLGIISINMAKIAIPNFGHVFLWLTSISIFYFGTKILVINSNINFNKLKLIFFVGLCITSSGVIIEFVTANFFGFYLSEVLPYSMGEMEATKNFSGNLFRVRGFSAEPGFTAMVYEFLFPLGFLYCYKKPSTYPILFFILFGYFILTSAASLIILFFIISIFLIRSNLKNFFKILFYLLLLTLVFYNQVAFYLIESLGPKLILVLTGESIRFELINSLLNIFIENPLGIGFGTQSYYFEALGSYQGIILPGGGALNLYLEIAISSGFLGLISFLIFIVCIVFQTLQHDKTPERDALIFSFLWLLGHHLFLTEYYFPMIWVSMAILNTYSFIEKKQEI